MAFEGYRLEDAEVVLVSYGISSRIARSAVDVARKEGHQGRALPAHHPLSPSRRSRIRRAGGEGLQVHLRRDEQRPDAGRHPAGTVAAEPCGPCLPLRRKPDRARTRSWRRSGRWHEMAAEEKIMGGHPGTVRRISRERAALRRRQRTTVPAAATEYCTSSSARRWPTWGSRTAAWS